MGTKRHLSELVVLAELAVLVANEFRRESDEDSAEKGSQGARLQLVMSSRETKQWPNVYLAPVRRVAR